MAEIPVNVNPEKLEQILNAALQVFAKNGYKKASTDEIVNIAGISKGLLFHYFKNKKNLYLFLYDYFIELMVKRVVEDYDMNEPDLFERIINSQQIKADIMREYPYVFDFLLSAYYDESPEIQSELMEKNLTYSNMGMHMAAQGVDTSKFKPGVDLQLVIKVIIWTAEGFMEEVRKSGKMDVDKVLADFEPYLALLKKSFYKEECLG